MAMTIEQSNTKRRRDMEFYQVINGQEAGPSVSAGDFLSDCGGYKVKETGRGFMAFRLLDCKHADGQRYQAFGDSVEHDEHKKPMTYRTMNEAFLACVKHKAA